MEKKGRSESKSDVTCVEAVEAAAEAEDGGVNGGGARGSCGGDVAAEAEDGGVKGGTAMMAAAARRTRRSDICRTYTMWRL